MASKHVWAGTTRIATSLVPGVKPVGGSLRAGTGASASATTTTESRLPIRAQQAPGIPAGQGLANRSAQAAQHASNLEQDPHYATSSSTGGGTGMATNHRLGPPGQPRQQPGGLDRRIPALPNSAAHVNMS